MGKELSTKRFVCVLKDGSKFFLDDKEAESIRNSIKGGADYLEIGESLISRYDFSRLVGSENYEEAERIKRGEWKCRYGFWHSFGEQCGHSACSKEELERLKGQET